MSNDQNNIPTEADVKLAQKFGKYLEGDTSKSSIEDPLYLRLDVAKKQDYTLQSKVVVQGQDTVWNSLSSQLEIKFSSSRKPIPLRSMNYSSWYKFAAAAVLLISLSVILWLQYNQTGYDIIASRSSQVQTVTLSDGTTVILRPNSELAYKENSSNLISVILTGEAVFDVTSNLTRTFNVETNNSRIVVTGTRFNVQTSKNQSAVFLLEGSVTFESLDASTSVVLSPGQASEMQVDGRLSQPYQFDEQTILSWTQSRMALANRPLISIVDELERHFGVQIQIPDSLNNELLGGSISLDSIDQTLQDLGLVLDGNFDVTDSGVYQFKSDP